MWKRQIEIQSQMCISSPKPWFGDKNETFQDFLSIFFCVCMKVLSHAAAAIIYFIAASVQCTLLKILVEM
jgi:hypothetical protein